MSFSDGFKKNYGIICLSPYGICLPPARIPQVAGITIPHRETVEEGGAEQDGEGRDPACRAQPEQ